ncbi:serine/threonine protein kinase related protein [Rhodopirellula maiorica SM1]|uniref:Serine/threonine protein kinase related protein n=1 Tax=Rhodopirellula maiorica SM1 TaxID=1265738 RepID=M5RMW9_9BACT|nr:PQQ-binding-like beta-propeller repeat protein [Rhodopirellula maiorica]EMI20673.1 serine/threonine protein kinase related protein [Rhodopirellula maiorica SM1]
MKRKLLASFAILAFTTTLSADDWLRFRGPSGSGVSVDTESLPTQWSPNANVAWKAEIPGAGVSSPIVVGDRVFVTCYSGYGLSRENPGEIKDLVRHLVCYDLKTGSKLWQKDVAATLPEDPYTGVGVPSHGYASHTPVSDGNTVFVFFGKSGVHAYSLDGAELWSVNVGKESDPWAWGSASSPIVFQDTVIVTAAAESQSIIGLDKSTGKELWRQEASGLDGMWGTPALVKLDDSRTDLVMSVAKEVWGLDPNNGKLRWYSAATGADQAQSSIVTDGNVAFAFTGRGGGSVAVKVGGMGETTEEAILWSGSDSARFASPIQYKSRLYSIANGVVTIVDAKSGDKIDQVRLDGAVRGAGDSVRLIIHRR